MFFSFIPWDCEPCESYQASCKDDMIPACDGSAVVTCVSPDNYEKYTFGAENIVGFFGNISCMGLKNFSEISLLNKKIEGNNLQYLTFLETKKILFGSHNV